MLLNNTKTRPSHYAVIIGVPEYQDDIKNLPYIYNDVKRLYHILLNCGFSEDHVYLLTTGENVSNFIFNSPTRENIKNAIQTVVEEAQPDDTVMFYFAGYTVDIFNRPHLLVHDTQLDYLLSTAIDFRSMLEQIQKIKANHVIRLFDISRSHFSSNRIFTSQMTSSIIDLLSLKTPGHATFVSCIADEYAHDDYEFQQGVFSYFLENEFEKISTNIQPQMQLANIAKTVTDKVIDWGFVRKIKQTPFYISFFETPFYLCYHPPEFKSQLTKIARDLENITDSEDDNFSNDSSESDYLVAAPTYSREITTFYSKKSLAATPQAGNNENEFKKISKRIIDSIDQFMNDYSHPSITIYRTEPVALKILSYFIDREFERFIEQTGPGERVKEAIAMEIFFKNTLENSHETSLYINLAGFSSYYWLWYCLPFESLRNRGKFMPANPIKINYIPLRVPAIMDNSNLNNAISSIFRDCTESMIDWAQQLARFQQNI